MPDTPPDDEQQVAADPFSTPTEPTSHRRPRRSSVWQWAGGIVGVVAVGVAAWFGLQQIPDGPASELSPPTTTVPSTTTTTPALLPDWSVVLTVTGEVDTDRGIAAGLLYDQLYVVTTVHAVSEATQISVEVNETATAASVIGADPVTGIAVLKLADAIPSEPIAVSETTVGDTILIAGQQGTVAAVDQRYDVSDTQRFYGLIQLADPPATSTGEVATTPDGRVVGLFTSPPNVAPSSFIIPIGPAFTVADELIEYGRVAHGHLGVQVADSPLGGAAVFSLPAESAYRDAGGQIGDTIVAVDDAPITFASHLIATITTYREGDTIALQIMRNNETLIIDVTLDRHPGV